MNDSQDIVLGSSTIQVVAPEFVVATDPYSSNDQNSGRVEQQIMTAGAAKPRFVSVVQQFDTTRKLFSASVPDGASLIVNTLTKNAGGNRIVQFVGRQIYIGSPVLTARMPEVISSANYPHYDWDSCLDDTGTSILNQPGVVMHKTQVRNNSGATQTIYIEIVTRYIVNNSSAAVQ